MIGQTVLNPHKCSLSPDAVNVPSRPLRKSSMCRSGSMLALLVAALPSLTFAQIPDGFEVVRITNDRSGDRRPKINNCGVIVNSKRINESEDGEEIFYHDNGRTVRITNDNIRDAFADINDLGIIVYTHAADGFGAGIITVFADGSSTELFPGTTPSINNPKHLSWVVHSDKGCRGADADIMFYDGQKTYRITENDGSNQSPEMNDNDWIAWDRLDFCDEPWTSDILMHDGERSIELPSLSSTPRGAAINNAGQVWWGGLGGLEMWENGRSRNIDDWGDGPEVNDLGEVYFIRWHDDEDTWDSWYYANGEFYRLTASSEWNVDGDINNDGEAVWMSGLRGAGEIYYMRRIRTGDSEFDGDIDHDDLVKLVECMTGPMWVERTDPGPEDSLCDCRFLDINHDGSVDLRDYAVLQQNFGQ